MGVMLGQPALWFQVFVLSLWARQRRERQVLNFRRIYICWTMLCLTLSRPSCYARKGRRTCCLKEINFRIVDHMVVSGFFSFFPPCNWMNEWNPGKTHKSGASFLYCNRFEPTPTTFSCLYGKIALAEFLHDPSYICRQGETWIKVFLINNSAFLVYIKWIQICIRNRIVLICQK